MFAFAVVAVSGAHLRPRVGREGRERRPPRAPPHGRRPRGARHAVGCDPRGGVDGPQEGGGRHQGGEEGGDRRRMEGGMHPRGGVGGVLHLEGL
eukprot:1184741-Prorocentrum_minimum.AAC.5